MIILEWERKMWKIHVTDAITEKNSFTSKFPPYCFSEELLLRLLYQKLWEPILKIIVWYTWASSYDVFLCASAGSLPLLTSVKLWKPARVKSVLICVMEGVMLLLVWRCHGMRHRQTQSFLAGCLETPPIFSIYHFVGVTFSTINLSTWNLDSTWNYGWGKCFWSRLLNILSFLEKHTSQAIERPGLLSWKLASLMEYHPTKWQWQLQQKKQCLSTPIGSSTSKSIFYPSFQPHLLIFQQLTLVSLSNLTSVIRLKWLRTCVILITQKKPWGLITELWLCRGRKLRTELWMWIDVNCLLIDSNFHTLLCEHRHLGITISVFSEMFLMRKVETDLVAVLLLVP